MESSVGADVAGFRGIRFRNRKHRQDCGHACPLNTGTSVRLQMATSCLWIWLLFTQLLDEQSQYQEQ